MHRTALSVACPALLALVPAATAAQGAMGAAAADLHFLTPTPDDPQSAAGDRYGEAVAIDGDRLVVGAPAHAGGKGVAYVYRHLAGRWVFEARLSVPIPKPWDTPAFGSAVAIEGDTIAVGAPSHDAGGQWDEGAVHLFVHDGSQWLLDHTLTGTTGDQGASVRFGTSVALDGGRLAVGATGEDDPGGTLDVGAVHVYDLGDPTLTPTTLHHPVAPVGLAYLGSSVALDDGRLVAAASNQGGGVGAAFLFEESGGTWAFVQALDPTHGTDAFGWDVAIDGDTVVVSATRGPTWTSGPRVYEFRSDGGGFPLYDVHQEPDAYAWQYGKSLALEGDLLLVGDPDGTAYSYGLVHLYARTKGGAFSLQQSFHSGGKGFGFDLALSAGRFLAGAPTDSGTGAARVATASAAFGEYGAGCPGPLAQTPRLFGSGLVEPGHSVRFHLEDGPAFGLGLILLGTHPTTLGVGPGCVIHVDPFAALGTYPVALDAEGFGVYAIPISAALNIPVATTFYAQGIAVSGGVPSALTNPVHVTLQTD